MIVEYAVVSKINDPAGNLALGMEVYVETAPPTEANNFKRGMTRVLEVDHRLGLSLRQPVFKLGEILLLDANGRDVRDTRKPSKWDIEIETFATAQEAADYAHGMAERMRAHSFVEDMKEGT